MPLGGRREYDPVPQSVRSHCAVHARVYTHVCTHVCTHVPYDGQLSSKPTGHPNGPEPDPVARNTISYNNILVSDKYMVFCYPMAIGVMTQKPALVDTTAPKIEGP